MADARRDKSYEADGMPRRSRRSATWLLGGLVLLLLSVLVVLQVFGLWEVFTPDTASDTLLLYALSSLNFAAFVVFTFIFVRSLLKLRRERRERQLGSKIKTRLVVYFIALSLLPIAAMAVFSYIFFNRSLEKWFSSLPEEVVNEARLAQAKQAERQAEALRDTAGAAAVALRGWPAPAGPLPTHDREAKIELLREILRKSGLAYAARVVPATAGEAENWHAAGLDLDDGAMNAIRRAAEAQGFEGGEVRAGVKVFDAVVVPVGDGARLVAAKERSTDESLGRLVEGAKRFEDFKRRQRRVRLLGLSTLGLLTLMLLFAATWSAIHLARGIATPIRALAEAADEVAGGNLGHRVTAIADDELALLAASFNQMTAQLEENRRSIESGAAELREKNLALAERRDYIETVLESLSAGVVSLDAHDRVTTINAAALSMLRLKDAPPAGTPLADILGAEDRTVVGRVLRRARLRGSASEQVELARLSPAPDAEALGGASRSDADERSNGGARANGGGAEEGKSGGGAVPVALTATAFGWRSAAGPGVVLVMEDLTELLAAQRAAAWSEVARRMAHEIKNPLTPIQLSAERIARHFQRLADGGHLPRGHNGGAAEFERVARVVGESTTTITREVAALKVMVDEFSRFARLPHARLEAADLNEVVRQAAALYEERTHGARLDLSLAHTLPVAALDAEQMRRVFVNLIDNALEALADSEGEQRITLATAHDPGRGLLLAEVTDTGHGIPRADFPHLFQPYFSTRRRGTGLGLAIVQRIIADHGGRIRAEQNRPRGARFIIELPAADDAEAKGHR
ncbi:MAG TPA: ATP-binding protein [Pyrinomonadaceae bacterium]|nr:ATP-binding protein [Pyrinomonadaceae bacterium]